MQITLNSLYYSSDNVYLNVQEDRLFISLSTSLILLWLSPMGMSH